MMASVFRKCGVLLFLLFASTSLYAQEDKVEQVIDGQRYYIHVVEQGHTLYAISKIYQSSVETIIKENPEAANGISIGQTLRIPAVESDEKWQNPIRIEDGYLVHKVGRGETLFGISKFYKVDVNDLLELNPEANAGIKNSQELLIPVNEVDRVHLPEFEELEADTLNRHLVQPGETLYAISKKYQVDVAELLSINDGLPAGLRSGEYIRIPSKEEAPFADMKEAYQVSVPDSLKLVQHFNVSLFLPFYLQYVDSLKTPVKAAKLQRISLSLYRGALLALDTLQAVGFKADVYVKDVYDLQSLDLAMNQNPSHPNLIIGPLQKDPMHHLLTDKVQADVHVVCPVPQSSKILLAHSNVSKVAPSSLTDMKNMGVFVADQHAKERVILINSEFVHDAMLVEEFSTAFKAEIQKKGGLHGTLYELRAGEAMSSVEALKKYLLPYEKNVIVVPAGPTAKSVIAHLFTNLSLLDADVYDITLYGTNDWLAFDFIDPNYKNRFHLRVPSSSYLDYSDRDTRKFVLNYRERFAAEPDYYSFLGYDLMWYYGLGMMQFGMDFPNHFSGVNQEGLLQSGFNYYKTGMESGFENRYVIFMEHQNFMLVPIGKSDVN